MRSSTSNVESFIGKQNAPQLLAESHGIFELLFDIMSFLATMVSKE